MGYFYGVHLKEYSYTKRALLRELSENSRASVTILAKKLKCSRNTIISNMRFLEKEFGLKYTLQFNKEKVGFMQNQVWSIKFGIKPKTEEIEKIFKDDIFAEIVAQTEGDFDLLMVRKVPTNTITNTGEKYKNWGLSKGIKLLKYRPSIRFSLAIVTHTGFTPISKETLQNIDFTRLGMNKLDKEMIIELNNNSRLTYRGLAKLLNEDVETIRYRFKRFTKANIIKRFTIVLKKPPMKYNIAFLMDYDLAPGLIGRYKEAHDYYLAIDGKMPLVNTFSYLALTSGRYLLFGIGCFENEEKAIQKAIIAHKEMFNEDNPAIHYAKITNMIKGSLPIRNIDIEKDFLNLKWD
jgi:DNA-binding Lrp family transcriptional regulator